MLIHALKMDDSFEKVSDYVYLHGTVERLNGFDIVYVEDMPTEPGKYACEVEIEGQEDTVPATFFYWTAPFAKVKDAIVFGNPEDSSIRVDPNNPEMLIKDRGLIVAVDDTEHLLDAERKFNERQAYL